LAVVLKFPRGNKANDDPSVQRDVTEQLARFQYLLITQRLWAVEWQEIANYTLPRKNSILVRRYPGTKRTNMLYDSTAIDARNKFASAIHSGLTSDYVRWFFLGTDDPELDQDQQTAIWLDNVGNLLLGDFNRSNFSQEQNEAYIDLTTFASACTFMEEIPQKKRGIFEGFRFRTEQPGQFAWSEGADGMVNVNFREIFMSKAAILEKWKDTPEEKLNVSKGSEDEQMSVIHGVIPDKEHEGSNRSFYILFNGKYQLSEGKFDEFPFLCPRWSKASGETYGRGPTHDALPDIRSLNKLREMELRALPKIIDPPLVAVNGDVIGPARLTPGGVTNVRGSRDSIGPLMSGIDLRQAGMSAEQLESKIRAIYHESELQYPQDQPQMTATEAAARREMMQQLLGPTLGRLEKEDLHPLISRAFNIRRRANALPPLPPKLLNAVQQGKVELRVRYDGAIARAQRASDVDSITRGFNVCAPIFQGDPEAMTVIDTDETVRQVFRKLGAPPQIVRDKDQTDKVRQVKAQQAAAQQQQQAAAQQAQMAGQAAPALKAAGKAPEPGSPLDQMNQQQQQPGNQQAA
jgi:hypothetical protein